MSRIVLIRAGQTDYEAESRLAGVLELPVNETGQQQIRQAVNEVRNLDLPIETILCTPGDPALATAQSIADELDDVKVRELDELRNVDQGLWQGLPESEVRKRYPKMFRACRERPQTIYAPQGESLSDACRRVSRVLNRAIRRYDVFAVVAAEPIATVIRCTLEHRGPTLASCLRGEDPKLVECFEATEFDPDAFVNFECVPDVAEAGGPGRR